MELSIDNVSKIFSDKTAVSNVSICLKPGIWGLLGANGAGKTTLMRMLVGLMDTSEGNICFDGQNIDELGERYRENIGYLPQEFGYDQDMSVIDYMEFISALKDIDKKSADLRIDELLKTLDLSDVKRKKISKLSGGMRRRVGVAQALLNNPKILIMDEPTAGLDPGERIKLRNYVSEFAHDRIVIISTHIVSDIEYIASEIMVMKEGKIIDTGTVSELEDSISGKVWTVQIAREQMMDYETKLRIVNQKEEADGSISVRYLSEKSLIEGSVSSKPSLEDLFLWLFPVEKEEEI